MDLTPHRFAPNLSKGRSCFPILKKGLLFDKPGACPRGGDGRTGLGRGPNDYTPPLCILAISLLPAPALSGQEVLGCLALLGIHPLTNLGHKVLPVRTFQTMGFAPVGGGVWE